MYTRSINISCISSMFKLESLPPTAEASKFNHIGLRGFAKLKNSKIPKTTGSGWVCPGLIRIKKIGKSSKNKVLRLYNSSQMSLVVQQHQIKYWCWSSCSQPLSPAEEILYSWWWPRLPWSWLPNTRVSDLPVRLHGHPAPTVRQHTRCIRPRPREVWTHRTSGIGNK